MSRRSKTRGKDEAVDLADKAQATARGVWDIVRSDFTPRVRSRVDEVAQRGGLTLQDIALLEFASHEELSERIANADRLAQVEETVQAERFVRDLLFDQRQARKHLRTIIIAINPVVNPGGSAHPTSEDEDDAPTKKRKALDDLADAEVSADDVGDELPN